MKGRKSKKEKIRICEGKEAKHLLLRHGNFTPSLSMFHMQSKLAGTLNQKMGFWYHQGCVRFFSEIALTWLDMHVSA